MNYPSGMIRRRVRQRTCVVLLALAGLGAATAAIAQDIPPAPPPEKAEPAAPPDKDTGKQQPVNLNGIIIQGKRDAFGDADKRLKALTDSLPCAGCDAKPRKKKFMRKALEAVADRLLPTEAPNHADYDANDKTLEFSQQGNCIGVNVNQCIPDNVK